MINKKTKLNNVIMFSIRFIQRIYKTLKGHQDLSVLLFELKPTYIIFIKTIVIEVIRQSTV